MIDLAPHHLEKVRTILGKNVPQCEVRAFGSRVNWTAKDYSDLDLAVVGSGKLSDDTIRYLKEAFEESDLPFRVDVLDWHTISPSFQKVIEKQYEVVQGAKSKGAACAWRQAALGDIAAPTRNALVGGPFGSNLVSTDYVDHGVPVIRGQNMGQRWVTGEFAYVTPPKAASLEANLARPGDIVFTQRGTLGQVSIVPEEPFDCYLISQSQMKLTVDRDKVDPLFIYYVFRTPDQLEYIRLHAIQTGVPHTNLGILRDTPVPVPAMEAQRAIAHILGTLDDKIELNRRMNETLEAMARAIFKSWFVDFDPVRAKSEGRDPGLPKHIADLFPDSFETSLWGMVPKGWSPTTWGKMVSLEYGRGLSNYNHEMGAYPVYGTNGRIGTCNEPLSQQPGIIIGRKGAYRGIHFSRTPFFVIDTAFYVVPRTELNIRWAFYEMLRHDINSMDSGSAIPSTSRETFYSLQVVAPPFPVQQEFASLLKPCWDRQTHNEEESRTLSALRDALLPKLICGEIRLKDVITQRINRRSGNGQSNRTPENAKSGNR